MLPSLTRPEARGATTRLGAVTNGLQAAMLLARGRAEGLAYVESGMAGAARSFWAAAICLPAFVSLRLLDWADSGGPRDSGHAFTAELLGYVIGWAGFALLSRPLVAMLGRTARWPRFIAAWNWCNVAQYCLLMAACVPELAGAPAWAQQAAGLVALGWALWLEWYATRLALEIAPVQAAGLVMVDVVIEMVIAGVTAMGADAMRDFLVGVVS